MEDRQPRAVLRHQRVPRDRARHADGVARTLVLCGRRYSGSALRDPVPHVPDPGLARSMTDRMSYVLLAAAAAALLAVHVAVKPGIRPTEVDAEAHSYGFASQWEGRLAEDFELPLRDGS